MSIESITIAFCAAVPSTVTAAIGSKLVPLIMNVVPSEHSGSGAIDVIVGGGELFFSEQPVVASSKQPSADKPVDKRMVAREGSCHTCFACRSHGNSTAIACVPVPVRTTGRTKPCMRIHTTAVRIGTPVAHR